MSRLGEDKGYLMSPVFELGVFNPLLLHIMMGPGFQVWLSLLMWVAWPSYVCRRLGLDYSSKALAYSWLCH